LKGGTALYYYVKKKIVREKFEPKHQEYQLTRRLKRIIDKEERSALFAHAKRGKKNSNFGKKQKKTRGSGWPRLLWRVKVEGLEGWKKTGPGARKGAQ